jgi:hypothetical protein
MPNWVNFTAIKSSVELAPLLRQYQVKLHRSGRDQYRGCCPILKLAHQASTHRGPVSGCPRQLVTKKSSRFRPWALPCAALIPRIPIWQAAASPSAFTAGRES